MASMREKLCQTKKGNENSSLLIKTQTCNNDILN